MCIVAGYSKEIDECFFSYNPGLKRRFPFVYEINAYTDSELAEILLLKINNSSWILDNCIDKTWLVKFFDRNINHFTNFGGDIDTFILNLKTVHGRRIFGKQLKIRKILTKEDFDVGIKKFISSKNLKHKDDYGKSDIWKQLYI